MAQELGLESGRRLIDLSHAVEDGMITYKGLPAPVISDFLSRERSRANYAEGTEFHIGKIEMVANTGTYLDTPSHRFADGDDLSGLALESVAGLDAVLIDVAGRQERGVGRGDFGAIDLRGKAVLVHTGWDAHWRTDTYASGEQPFLTREAAHHLIKSGARLVGIDSLNIDDAPADGTRPAHTTLLRAGIPIVEHLTGLDQLPLSGFRITAAPARVAGLATFPVRAYAVIEA